MPTASITGASGEWISDRALLNKAVSPFSENTPRAGRPVHPWHPPGRSPSVSSAVGLPGCGGGSDSLQDALKSLPRAHTLDLCPEGIPCSLTVRKRGSMVFRSSQASSVVRGLGLSVVLVACAVTGHGGLVFAQGAPDCTPYPGAAYAAGANGTFWGSDFVLSNPHTETVSGVVIYTPRDVSRGTDQDIEFIYRLTPRSVYVIPSIIENLLRGEKGFGVLCVKPDYGTLEPIGRLKTYNYDPDNIAAGRFGQSIEQEAWTYPNGEDAFTIGGPLERTNIIAVTGPEGAVITVAAYSPDGIRQEGSLTHYLDPNRYYQWSGNAQQTGAELFAGMPLAENSTLIAGNVGGTAILWGSVVNNFTGDGYSPRFSNRVRGDVPEPTNEPPTLTCLRELSSQGDVCDNDEDGDIDHTVGVSAFGPFFGGPVEFEWQGEDQEGDEFGVEALNETLPSYATLEGRSLVIDPEPEHVGQDFFVDFRPCDAHGCGHQMIVHFKVNE
jgi:hypothetical protein